MINCTDPICEIASLPESEVRFTQGIRILDMVIGGLLIYLGITGKIGKVVMAIIVIFSLLAIFYNIYYIIKRHSEKTNT